ncbi:hypothetical protein GCM10011533_05650 [Streptosporangium jomthongense]|nr:hypothetical protein GCM10011533_05650 [Streptosporangium jomthongense]
MNGNNGPEPGFGVTEKRQMFVVIEFGMAEYSHGESPLFPGLNGRSDKELKGDDLIGRALLCIAQDALQTC